MPSFSSMDMHETLLFSPDAVYGSVFDPVVISSSLAVNINLPAGSWTWFSVDALTNDMSVSNILSSIDVADAYIKSTSGFSTYFSGFGWYGSVNSKNFIYKGLTGKISLDRKKHKRSPYLFEITDKGIKVL